MISPNKTYAEQSAVFHCVGPLDKDHEVLYSGNDNFQYIGHHLFDFFFENEVTLCSTLISLK